MGSGCCSPWSQASAGVGAPFERVVTWSGPSPEPPNPLVSPPGCCPHRKGGSGDRSGQEQGRGALCSQGWALGCDWMVWGRDTPPRAPVGPTRPPVLALPLPRPVRGCFGSSCGGRPGPSLPLGLGGACRGASSSSTAPGLAVGGPTDPPPPPPGEAAHLYANAGRDPGGASWEPSQVSAQLLGRGRERVVCPRGQQGWAAGGVPGTAAPSCPVETPVGCPGVRPTSRRGTRPGLGSLQGGGPRAGSLAGPAARPSLCSPEQVSRRG